MLVHPMTQAHPTSYCVIESINIFDHEMEGEAARREGGSSDKEGAGSRGEGGGGRRRMSYGVIHYTHICDLQTGELQESTSQYLEPMVRQQKLDESPGILNNGFRQRSVAIGICSHTISLSRTLRWDELNVLADVLLDFRTLRRVLPLRFT